MLASGFVALLAVSSTILCSCEQVEIPVRFLFGRSKGLEVKSPVVYKDLLVGQVRAVDLGDDGRVHVDATLKWAVGKHLNKPATALIVRNKFGYFGTTRCVEIFVAEEAEPIARPVKEIEGCNSRTALLLWQGSHMAKTFMADHQEELDSIKQGARDAAGWVEEFAESDQVREFIEKANELAEATGERARELYEELREEWPEIGEKLDRLCKRLEEMGRSDEARQLRESVEKFFSKLFSRDEEAEDR